MTNSALRLVLVLSILATSCRAPEASQTLPPPAPVVTAAPSTVPAPLPASVAPGQTLPPGSSTTVAPGQPGGAPCAPGRAERPQFGVTVVHKGEAARFDRPCYYAPSGVPLAITVTNAAKNPQTGRPLVIDVTILHASALPSVDADGRTRVEVATVPARPNPNGQPPPTSPIVARSPSSVEGAPVLLTAGPLPPGQYGLRLNFDVSPSARLVVQ